MDPPLTLRLRPEFKDVPSERPFLASSTIPTEVEDLIMQQAFSDSWSPLEPCVDGYLQDCKAEAMRLAIPPPFWRSWLVERLEYLRTRASSRDLDGNWTRKPGPFSHLSRMRDLCRDVQSQLIQVLDYMLGQQPELRTRPIVVLEWAVYACEKSLKLFSSLSLDPSFGAIYQGRWGFELINALAHDGCVLKIVLASDMTPDEVNSMLTLIGLPAKQE